MPIEREETAVISVRVPARLHLIVKKQAKKRGLNISDWCRKLIISAAKYTEEK